MEGRGWWEAVAGGRCRCREAGGGRWVAGGRWRLTRAYTPRGKSFGTNCKPQDSWMGHATSPIGAEHLGSEAAVWPPWAPSCLCAPSSATKASRCWVWVAGVSAPCRLTHPLPPKACPCSWGSAKAASEGPAHHPNSGSDMRWCRFQFCWAIGRTYYRLMGLRSPHLAPTRLPGPPEGRPWGQLFP